MKLDAKFSELEQVVEATFGQIQNVSDGGFERGYAQGYMRGNTEGYTKGHEDGVEQGYADGYMEGVESVPDYLLLAVNNSLTEYISTDVKNIRACAFRAATKLVKVDFPNATSGGNYAFMECSYLREVNLPSLSSAGQNFFQSCSSLEFLTLPNLRTIPNNCFNSCSKLKTLVLSLGSVCSLGSTGAFSSTPIASGTGYIYVPATLVEKYKTATNWSTYADQIRAIEDYPEITN